MLFSRAFQSASEDLAAKSIKYKYLNDWRLTRPYISHRERLDLSEHRAAMYTGWSVAEVIPHLDVLVTIKQEQLLLSLELPCRFLLLNGHFYWRFYINADTRRCNTGLQWESGKILINLRFVCEWQQTAEESPTGLFNNRRHKKEPNFYGENVWPGNCGSAALTLKPPSEGFMWALRNRNLFL